MPGLTGLGLDHHFAAVIAQHANPASDHAQHQRIDIRRQQQIAAAADHQHRHLVLQPVGQGFAHIGVAMGLGKQPGLDIHAKAVERLERNLRLNLQTHNRPFNSITSKSLARSIRSSTCSKPWSPS
ncbi:hypothetical protein D3C85_1416540 [compost metagenome]